jgi:MSHA biogenesis protein MshP
MPAIRVRSYASSRDQQSGFSLVAAVFLIVVLAGLAAFAVQVAMSQYQGANLVLLEARAQAAADSGIEYGANRTLRAGGCAAIRSPLTLNQPGLSGYSVNVSCAATNGHKVNGTPYTVYVLTSTATYGTYGRSGYVSRSVTRNVTNAPP